MDRISRPVEVPDGGPGQGPAIGTFVAVGDPALAETLASAFDVLVVDLEHGPLDVGEAQGLLIAIQARGRAAYVRIASTIDPRLAAALDAGADGVVAPMVESPEETELFVSRTRYPPAGRRGFGPRRAAHLPDGPRDRPLCAVQIETEVGVAAAESIAAVEGVDLVVLGCSDLAMSLGASGEIHTEAVRDAVARVGSAATEAGARFALAAGGDVTRVAELMLGGPDLVLYGLDLRIYAAAGKRTAEALREATSATPGGGHQQTTTEMGRTDG